MLDKNNVISIVVDKSSWINTYIPEFIKQLESFGYQVDMHYDHRNLKYHDIVFYYSYSKIIPVSDLNKNKHNLVVHESRLPQGKGWSPLTWQVLEGKNDIPITLFEATEKVDAGRVYLVDEMKFSGRELIDELRDVQAKYTFKLSQRFIMNYSDVISQAYQQVGEESFYPRRRPEHSQLDINLPIKNLFNLLRVVDNESYPAFFEIEGERYELHVHKT